MTGYFKVDSRADLETAIQIADIAGAIGTAFLFRALRDGRIALLPLLPDDSSARFKAFARLSKSRPICPLPALTMRARLKGAGR